MKHMWRVKTRFGKYKFIHEFSNASCALKENKIELKFGKLELLMGWKVH
jgi:hypothetical protein